jgi:hypothetical protein
MIAEENYDKEFNRFEILQLYMMITEKILEHFKRNIPYASNINFIKNFSAIFESKIAKYF